MTASVSSALGSPDWGTEKTRMGHMRRAKRGAKWSRDRSTVFRLEQDRGRAHSGRDRELDPGLRGGAEPRARAALAGLGLLARYSSVTRRLSVPARGWRASMPISVPLGASITHSSFPR